MMKTRDLAHLALPFVLAAPLAIACGGNVTTTGTSTTTGSISTIASACAAWCNNAGCAALVPASVGDCPSWCDRGYGYTSLGACASQWIDLVACRAAESCGDGTCGDQVNATQDCCVANPSACSPPKTDGGSSTDGG